MRSNLEESRNVSFCRLEVDKLVKENNQLIERLRMLEKEKNIYYTELKCVSPMKIQQSTERSMGKSLIQNSRKKVSNKGERWNLIEEKLKLIRQENEQLKANLEINWSILSLYLSNQASSDFSLSSFLRAAFLIYISAFNFNSLALFFLSNF